MVPRTLDDARREVIKRYKHWLEIAPKQEFVDEGIEVDEGFEVPTIEEDEPLRKELAYRRSRIERYNIALYSLPWFKPIMKAWMVDVKFGDENPFVDSRCSDCQGDKCEVSEEKGREKIDMLLKDPSGFTEQTSGSLAVTVQNYLTKQLRLKITDRGGACDGGGGHIGCPCTDSECDWIIAAINAQFAPAVKAGLLAVQIAWFKPSLPGFLNDPGMDAWIEQHPEES